MSDSLEEIVAEMREFRRMNTGDANTDIQQWADRLGSLRLDNEHLKLAVREQYGRAEASERAMEEACRLLRKIAKHLPGSLDSAGLYDELDAFLAKKE